MEKKSLLCAILLILILSNKVIDAQEYYASWAPLSENAPIEAKNQMRSNYLKTPTQDEFELPAYPNALIVSITGIGLRPSDSTKLPIITLISIDKPLKVIEFYMNQIQKYSNWKWNKRFKMFYKDNLAKALNRHSPYIMIQHATPDEFDLVNISKTLRENVASKIVVCFNPNTIR